MNELMIANLRRNWPVVGAILLLAVFLVSHLLLFGPVAARYQRALKRSGEMGMAFDPALIQRAIPPRVFALLSNNALPASVALDRGNSGALATELLEDLSRRAGRHGMEVVGTEPGTVTQQATWVQVHAHLRLRSTYSQFVSFLDEMARDGALLSVDRFTLNATEGSSHDLELWVSRIVLKQPGAHS